MRTRLTKGLLGAVTVLILGLSVLVPRATIGSSGNTFFVANYGADRTGCGTQKQPCRSISQAIENASDGDVIWVGPGHYGNVSGDPNFGGTGDEQPQAFSTFQLGALGCMICVDKAVAIYSAAGAAVTVITGILSNSINTNVMIVRDGVVFGSTGHGFTLTGRVLFGLVISQQGGSANNVTVSGNVDIGDNTGFAYSGPDPAIVRKCPDPQRCVLTAQVLFDSNAALGNGIGFHLMLNANWNQGSFIVRHDLASRASVGFFIDPGITCEGFFVCPSGSPTVQLLANVATGNGTGFSSNGTGPITGNTASGNSSTGFSLTAPVQERFSGNTAIGSGGPGVIVSLVPQTGAGFSSFSQNNFYGNDRNRPAPLLPGPGARCGVFLSPPPPPPTVTLPAPNNFWGTTTGSSDTSGGACDQNGGITIAQPLAGTPFPITSLF